MSKGAGRGGAIQILIDVAEAMTAAAGETAALNRLASLALQATGADRSAILVRDPEGRTRLLPAAGASRTKGDPEEQLRKFRAMEPIDIESDPDRLALWEESRTVVLDDAASSGLIPESWRRTWGSKSVAFAPLKAGGENYGLLALDYVTQGHQFEPGEARLLDAIASAAGVALRSARLVERLKRSVEIERRLSECSAAVQSGRSLSEVLGLVMEQFTSLLSGTSCSILMLSPDRETLYPVAYTGSKPQTPLVRISDLPKRDVASIEKSLAQAPDRPITIPDARSLIGWENVIPREIGPGLLIPLWDGSTLLGFVAVGRSDERFSDEEIRVASALAVQAALALTQARLHDELSARLTVIEALQQLSGIVAAPTRTRRIVPALNRSVCHQMGAECLRVSFHDTELPDLLGAMTANDDEVDLVRHWRKAGKGHEVIVGDRLSLPISLAGRLAGVISFRTSQGLNQSTIDVLRSIASGLGDIAYKAKLRRTADRRLQQLTLAAERERIAQDLHDTVGQTFYGIGLKLQDLLADAVDPRLATQLADIRSSAAQAVADVRSAVYALSFLHVREKGLIPSLRALAKQFQRATGVSTELRIAGSFPRLKEEIVSALYRMTHEALVNVERHARATGVVISLDARDREIELSIRDDGVGLHQRQARDWRSAAHFGMRNMAKAIEEVGGRFSASPSEPRGLAIRARLSLNGQADK